MKLVRMIPRLGALPEMLGFYCAPCHERKRLSIERTSVTGKGGEFLTTDGPQYPMVELFTGGHDLALMFVNAAATCCLLSLAFMDARAYGAAKFIAMHVHRHRHP
jgi:hypothetical protein